MSTVPDPSVRTATVTLRYWAAARHAAGTDSDAVEVTGPTPLSELLATARAAHEGRRFADVLACCSVMVGDRPVTTDDPTTVLVQPGQSVEFLPPFAGG